MSSLFSAQQDAFRRLMAGVGVSTDLGAPKVQCGNCDELQPCLHCGGNVDHKSPAYQALEWGMMVAERHSDPLHKIAEVGHAVANAPARDGSAAWGAVDQIIRNTHAFHLLTTQGRNVLGSMAELLTGGRSGDPISADIPADVDGEIGGGNGVQGMSDEGGSAGGPGGAVAADEDGGMGGGNKVPGMGEGDLKVPGMGDPLQPNPSNREECCCVAKDIKVKEPITARLNYNAKDYFYLHVHPIVEKGKGTPKSCTLVWEELPSSSYDPGGGVIPGGVYSNLNNHPAFKGRAEDKAKKQPAIKGMAEGALEALQKFPCPEKEIPEIYDKPNMGRPGTLIIRITLKSGCDSSKIVKYILLLTPTSIRDPQLKGPYVIGENDFIAGAIMKTIYDATPHRTH